MKTFQHFALLCVVVLVAVASAQELTPEQLQQLTERDLHYHQSPLGKLNLEADALASSRSPWNGQGTWLTLMYMFRVGDAPAIELGLTEDQQQRLSFLRKDSNIGAGFREKMQQNPTPEYTQALEAYKAVNLQLRENDPFLERATEEQKDVYRDAQATMVGFLATAIQAEIQETLTPEQMLQVRKWKCK